MTENEKLAEIVRRLIEVRDILRSEGYPRSASDVEAGIAALRSPSPSGTEALVKVLEPFAELAEMVSDEHRDSRPVIYGFDTSRATLLTIGHLRAAKAALSEHRNGTAS